MKTIVGQKKVEEKIYKLMEEMIKKETYYEH